MPPLTDEQRKTVEGTIKSCAGTADFWQCQRYTDRATDFSQRVEALTALLARHDELEAALNTERRAGDWKCKCAAPLVVCRDCWNQKCSIVVEQEQVIAKAVKRIDELEAAGGSL